MPKTTNTLTNECESKRRYRAWFITINENAVCFPDLQQRLDEFPGVKMYAYIFHEPDEDHTNKHAHLCLELENARTFNAIQMHLPGAHIEVMKGRLNTYGYLIHNSFSSRSKTPYPLTALHTRDKGDLSKIEQMINRLDDLEEWDDTQVFRYMVEGVDTAFKFVLRFGFQAYQKYWPAYTRLIVDLQDDLQFAEYKRKLIYDGEVCLPF